MNDNKAKQIVLKYLVSLYGKDNGVRIFTENMDSLFSFHGVAWDLGHQCFPFFCELFLYDFLFDPENCTPLSKTHYEIWAELEDAILNKNNTRHVYTLPRSFGKSSTITVPLALFCALYCIHPCIVIQSATEGLAENFIKTIKLQIEGNKLIESCFGQVVQVGKGVKYNLNIPPQGNRQSVV